MTPAELLQAIDQFVLSLQQAIRALEADEQPDLTHIHAAMQTILSAAGNLAPADAKAMLMPLNDAVLAVDRLQAAITAKAAVNQSTLQNAHAGGGH